MTDEKQEAVEWMEARGFKLLTFSIMKPGFDWGKRYQFMRPEWDEPSTFCLRDMHPAFNIAGLSYREITD